MNNKSKYIGVYKAKNSDKWYSKINHNHKNIHLGTFDNEEYAAKAYDVKLFELKCDNAKFNFKENKHMCEVEWCDSLAVTKFKGKWLCAKHKGQLLKCGEFLRLTHRDKNEIIEDGEYAYIILYDINMTPIAKAKIDAYNIDTVRNYKWYLRADGYVATNNYNGKYGYLHKIIYGDSEKKYIDHKDRNRLNNTRDNLREATGTENGMNKGIRSNNKSGKVGVYWIQSLSKWGAEITVSGKRIKLGTYKNKDDAIKARIDAEVKYFKEYRPDDEIKKYT